jgi:protein-disulfide isomerase
MKTLSVAINAQDHVLGKQDAPWTLVEYGDYECPHCGAAFPIVKRVQEELGDELLLVFRNFPLAEMHPHAEHAAETAEFAGASGRYWEMHDLLYTNQRTLDDQSLLEFAWKLDLSQEKLRDSLKEGAYREHVAGDFHSGVRSGVNGTPTFFINGQRYDGSWEFDHLVSAIRSQPALSRQS